MKVRLNVMTVDEDFEFDMPAAPRTGDSIMFREEEPSITVVHHVLWTPQDPEFDVEVLGTDPGAEAMQAERRARRGR